MTAKIEDLSTEELKNKLDSINSEKEAWFAKKQEYTRALAAIIGDVKTTRSDRDKLTKSVRDAKSKRDKVDDEIKKLIAQIKDLKRKKQDVRMPQDRSFQQGRSFGGRNQRLSPGRMKEMLQTLELKLETEVMSFSAEKKLMQKIKEMKTQIENTVEQSHALDDIKKLSKRIDELKKESNVYHVTVQESAKNSQVKHESMIEHSKNIEELKKNEQDAFSKFVELKNEYTSLHDEYKKRTGQVKKQRAEEKARDDVKVQKEQKKQLKNLKKEVDTKLKERKKLTTEDLLIMQAGKETDE